MELEISPKSFLYEQVADKIATLVNHGSLRPGDRIPSVRKMSSQQGISISTVLEAYYLLESRGIVEAKSQSGFYVTVGPQDPWSPPKFSNPPTGVNDVGVNDLIMEIAEMAQSDDIIQLGFGMPHADIYPTQRLNRVLAATARRLGQVTNTYDISPGSEDLRRQLARRSLDWGCNLTSDELVITNGATEALNLCLRAVAKPGDIIAVDSPTHFGFLQIIESLGMKTIEIPTHCGDGPSLTALEQVLDNNDVKACVFSLNSQNPLGFIATDDTKRQLVELLAARKIPLIEDDVYGDIYFGSTRPKIAKAFDKQGLVMLCSSFSKSLAPGFRVGWVATGRYHDAIKKLKFANSIGTPLVLQATIAEYLRSGGYDHFLRKIRRTYETQSRLMTRAIRNYFPEGTWFTNPKGGMVVWVEFPEGFDGMKLFRSAAAENIAIAPGPIFSPTNQYQNCVRINFAELWSDEVDRALIKLGKMAEQQWGAR